MTAEEFKDGVYVESDPTEVMKHHRMMRGLTQNDMAEKLDMSVVSYSKIERGITSLTVGRMMEIANILEVHPSRLMGIETDLYVRLQLNDLQEKYDELNQRNERLIFDLKSFLLKLRIDLPNVGFTKILNFLMPKTSELYKIVAEVEESIENDIVNPKSDPVK